MSTETRLITAEEFDQMHFDVPVELVRGEIVYPYGEDGMTRPDLVHGAICGNIYHSLRVWARSNDYGFVVTNDSGFRTEQDPDSIRGADVAFFPMDRLPNGKLPRRTRDIVPQLCVEVLSPSNTASEINRKRQEYLGCGVEEVWIVDPDMRSVEVFRRDAAPKSYEETETLTSSALVEFAAPVEDFFEGV